MPTNYITVFFSFISSCRALLISKKGFGKHRNIMTFKTETAVVVYYYYYYYFTIIYCYCFSLSNVCTRKEWINSWNSYYLTIFYFIEFTRFRRRNDIDNCCSFPPGFGCHRNESLYCFTHLYFSKCSGSCLRILHLRLLHEILIISSYYELL